MSENRVLKTNELVRKYINDTILKELSLKSGVFVTIAKVDTSSDLRYTRVFVSVFPEGEFNYVTKTLEKELYKIQKSLNQKLGIKPTPRITFVSDFTETKADKIEKLLKEL
ncbi:MAG: 30S ribosome-binding factor RbfA [Candidatus Moraniibacteriota bacterium]